MNTDDIRIADEWVAHLEARAFGWVDAIRAVVRDLALRHGAIDDDLFDRIRTCGSGPLRRLVIALVAAHDRAEIERALATVPRHSARRHVEISHYRAHEVGHWVGGLEATREVLLVLAEQYGPLSHDNCERVLGCLDASWLRAITLQLAGAADQQAVERMIARLPAVSGR